MSTKKLGFTEAIVSKVNWVRASITCSRVDNSEPKVNDRGDVKTRDAERWVLIGHWHSCVRVYPPSRRSDSALLDDLDDAIGNIE